MSELKVLPCEISDAAEILAGQIAAFSNPPEPFFFILFPRREAREKAVQKMLDWWLGDTSAMYMKVVDEAGQIISAAKWCIYEEPLTAEQMDERVHADWHSDEDTNHWASFIIHQVHSYRLKRTNGQRCCVLDMMSTHPSHQFRGAGTLLVEWGTRIADEMNVPCYIEGTIIAKRLYEKCGFVTSEAVIVVDVPEKWTQRPDIRYWFYRRPSKAENALYGGAETKMVKDLGDNKKAC